MHFDPATLPTKLQSQRGLTSSDADYLNRTSLVRRYAKHLIDQGERVTLDKVRELLVWVDRGYSLKADQIAFALRGYYERGEVDRYSSNGQPVLIDGTRFSTVRKAGQSLGISPQTVLNRIKSDRPEWAGWQRA